MPCFPCGGPRRLRHNYPRPVAHLNVPGLPIDLDAPAATSVPSRKSLSLVTELPLEGLASVSLTGCDHAGVRTNQDAFAGDACCGGDPERGLFCVFDGHGPNGHLVAADLASGLPTVVAAQLGTDDPVPVAKALRRAFLQQNVSLLKSAVDCSLSGSTCVAVLLEPRESAAYIASVGDSRVVAALARADGGSTASSRQPRPFGNLEAVEWTNDHTPERPDEEKRLIAAGARVAPTGGAGGAAETEVHHGAVKRVWLPEKDTPGLAMSRSFGDAIGATVGVIAEPTVTKWQLTPDHRFAILATDGVWEFISSLGGGRPRRPRARRAAAHGPRRRLFARDGGEPAVGGARGLRRRHYGRDSAVRLRAARVGYSLLAQNRVYSCSHGTTKVPSHIPNLSSFDAAVNFWPLLPNAVIV